MHPIKLSRLICLDRIASFEKWKISYVIRNSQFNSLSFMHLNLSCSRLFFTVNLYFTYAEFWKQQPSTCRRCRYGSVAGIEWVWLTGETGLGDSGTETGIGWSMTPNANAHVSTAHFAAVSAKPNSSSNRFTSRANSSDIGTRQKRWSTPRATRFSSALTRTKISLLYCPQ